MPFSFLGSPGRFLRVICVELLTPLSRRGPCWGKTSPHSVGPAAVVGFVYDIYVVCVVYVASVVSVVCGVCEISGLVSAGYVVL